MGVAAAAIGVAGCGSGSGSGAAGGGSGSGSAQATVPASAIRQAADVSSAAKGYRAQFTMRMTVPSSGTVDATGTGSFSPGGKGQMLMTVGLPGSSSGQMQIQMVMDGQTFYEKLPSQAAAALPGGKSWLRIDLAEVAKLAHLPGLSSLGSLTGSSSMTDPGQFLSYLKAESSGPPKNLGQQTIGGVDTTHYRLTLDPAKFANVVPAADRAAAQQLSKAVSKYLKGKAMPVDVWIDSAHLVRREQLAYAMTLPGSSTPVKADITIDMLSYGAQPAPAIPPADQTLDLAGLLKKLP